MMRGQDMDAERFAVYLRKLRTSFSFEAIVDKYYSLLEQQALVEADRKHTHTMNAEACDTMRTDMHDGYR
jgi:hypothetical protein